VTPKLPLALGRITPLTIIGLRGWRLFLRQLIILQASRDRHKEPFDRITNRVLQTYQHETDEQRNKRIFDRSCARSVAAQPTYCSWHYL
jgi:hypothetical protein